MRYNWFAFFLYDTIGVIIWACLSVGLGYAGGSLLSDFPLLGMIVGIALGALVGWIMQRIQSYIFELFDVRRGVSAV